MDAPGWSFLGVLAGAIVGAAASAGTAILTTRSAAKAQTRADMLVRSERFRTFQRDNLIAVQEALQDVARAASSMYHEDVMAHRAGADWTKTLVSPEVDEATLIANRKLSALEERIQDDALRERIRTAHTEFTSIGVAPSEREATARMASASETFTEAMRMLGETLRGLY